MSTTTWHVRVDYRRPSTNEAEADAVLEELGDLRPALTLGDDDRQSITVHLEASTLRQAIATALQRVEAAVDTKAVGVEALTRGEIHDQLTRPALPQLVGHAEVAELLGVSRQRAAKLAERSDFPPAVMQIKAGPLRVLEQVEAWAATWPRKGGRPSKSTTSES